LFSYNSKHNEANGENNGDGCNNNISYNCGVEGETDNPDIIRLRIQKAKNAFAILLLSKGVPMLLAGDEFLNTQQGNNNGYCQDNELCWLDWRMAEKNAEMIRFVSALIALRKRHPSLMRRRFLTGRSMLEGKMPDIAWHGSQLYSPEWFNPEARLLAFTLAGIDDCEADLHIILNMSEQNITLQLPVIEGKKWCLALDTALPAPLDIIVPAQQQAVDAPAYWIRSMSVVVLENYPL